MTQSVDVREFLQGFLGEADEHLGRITGNLAAIERAPTRHHPRAVSELFRSLHTLKGLAGMMGIEPIVELAHAMESLVRRADRSGGTLPAGALDPLVDGAKAIAQRVRAVADGETVAVVPEALLATLEGLSADSVPTTAESDPAAVRGLDEAIAHKLTASERAELEQAQGRDETILQLEFTPTPEKAASGTSITTIRAAVGELGRVVRVLPVAVPSTADAPGGLRFVLLVATQESADRFAAIPGIEPDALTIVSLAAARPMPPPEDDIFDRASRKGVVRMDVAKLDATLEQLSALSICRLRMREEVQSLARAGVDVRRLQTLLEDDLRQLRRMRSSLLDLRMVPLVHVLEPLPLILRGLRNATGKQVRLELDVGDAELDKTVAERLFPALVHIVRNAVDHGLEDADTRRTRGKSIEGVVRVQAFAPSSAVLDISIADDGGGIDAAAVARRAGRPTPRTDEELLEILTSPGFSTRETITTTSGRGMGLDIVRQTMEALGGSLELENRPGEGTTMRIRAPLTVAIIDAFSFQAGTERYLAPIAVVDAIVEVEPERIVRPPTGSSDRDVEMLNVRGNVVPLVSLRAAMGLRRADDEPRAMIVRRHGSAWAFTVTRMLGQQEVLVRPLADPLVQVAGVAGSADLGDGRPTLVLDLLALATRMARSRRNEVRA